MIEIETEVELRNLLAEKIEVHNIAFQGINFLQFKAEMDQKSFENCLFVGCVLDDAQTCSLLENNFVFPALKLPYPTHPVKLYSREDLYFGFDRTKNESYADTLDDRVYQHYKKTGKDDLSVRESLGRRLHDHGITNALTNFLSRYDALKIVAIMGGHSLSRTDPMFRQVAEISAKMSVQGHLMLSGGGPGAMEATHLGVWLAGRSEQDWDKVFEILSTAPSYKDPNWLSTAFEVIERFPSLYNIESLGIPTWLYGHEPPTPFASHIAKYFANSVREDGLLAIAKGGVIFSPGSAGTIQEIFQDATQNHYLTEGVSSPMVFLGKEYWSNSYPIFPLLQKLLAENKYKHLNLSISDESDEIIKTIERFSKEMEEA